MIDTNSVLGYAAPMIVSPGEQIAFHLSSATLTAAEATLVRVRLADPDPNGPGMKLSEPGTPIDGAVALRYQPIRPGSCAIVADAPVPCRTGRVLGRLLPLADAPGGGAADHPRPLAQH